MNLRRATLLLCSFSLFLAAGSAMAGNDSNSQPTHDSSAFMKKVASGSTAEVQIGRLALDRSDDPQLKQVAQRLVTDHSQANDRLKAIAAQKGVSLPAQPKPEDQSKVTRLQSKSGQAFDQAWIAMNIKDHKKDIDMFSKASQNLDDPAVRQFAADTLPKLKTHLQLVQQLQQGNPQGGMDSGQGGR